MQEIPDLIISWPGYQLSWLWGFFYSFPWYLQYIHFSILNRPWISPTKLLHLYCSQLPSNLVWSYFIASVVETVLFSTLKGLKRLAAAVSSCPQIIAWAIKTLALKSSMVINSKIVIYYGQNVDHLYINEPQDYPFLF